MAGAGNLGRLRGIDGLRALAATSVLTLHVYLFSTAPGASRPGASGIVGRLAGNTRDGLILFFVLSGFLLYRPFAAAILGRVSELGVGSYLRNRALRILPAYWVILLATSLIMQTAVIGYSPYDVGRLLNPGILVQNLLLVQSYSLHTVNTGIAPAWSLCVEAVFYLVLPVIALAALAATRRRGEQRLSSALGPGVVLIVVGVATKALLNRVGIAPNGFSGLVVSQLFPAFAELFGMGMVAAVVHVQVDRGELKLPRRTAALLTVLAAGGLVAIVLLAPVYRYGAPFTDSLVGVVCAAAILAVSLPGGGARHGRALLESRPVSTIGMWSYSIYLWHMPVILLLRKWGVESSSGATLAGCWLAAFALTAALSAVTYSFVERPMLRRKRRWAGERVEEPTLQPALGQIPAG